MPFRRLLFLLLLFLVTSFSFESFGGLVDPALKWKTVKTEHFSIHYYEGEEEVAGKIVGMAEEIYREITTKFNAHPWGRTEVVVVDNHDLANGFTLIIPYNLVVLRVVPPLADSTLGDYDDWLRELFLHEYTHVVHITDTGYPAKALKVLVGKLMAPNGLTPGWVTEGIATYFETERTGRGRGRSSFTDMLLRTDILKGRFQKIDEMAGTKYEWPSWQAQYLYGVGFWQFLAERYGEEKMIEFSHHYGSSLRFFMLNSQAKRSYRKEWTPEEEKICSETHWVDRGTYKTRQTLPEICDDRGLTFYKLWDEWKAELTRRYGAVQEAVTQAGLKEGEAYLTPEEGGSFSLPTFAPDGKKIAYFATSIHHRPELRLKDLETGKERVLLKSRDVQQMSFSRDGEKLVFSSVGTHKRYNQFSDLHEVDLKSGKVKQITRGDRARDPDVAFDGRIVAVLQKTGHAELSVYDPGTKKWKKIRRADQFDHPRWMPNGRDVVVSIHGCGNQPRRGVEGEAPSGLAGGGGVPSPSDSQRQGTYLASGNSMADRYDASPCQRDLWIIDGETGEGRRVTNDVAIEDRPVVDGEARVVYYSSDKTGIPNIYRYDPYTDSTRQVTNVITGAFAPSLTPDGKLLFQYYNGKGFEVRRSERIPGPALSAPVPSSDAGRDLLSSARVFEKLGDGPAGAAGSAEPGILFGAKNYTPFPKLLIPRHLLPNFAFIDGAVFLSATLSNFDPLYRHFWFGDVTYRSDNGFVGFDLGYTYNRYLPISVGFSDFSVNYGDVFGLGTDFFEERRRAYGGVSIPLGAHRAIFQYFFEDRSEQSGLPPGTTLSTFGNYAGLFAQYAYRKTQSTAAAISPEGGENLTVNVEGTNSFLGASSQLEQFVVWGDARKYILMPYAPHHVVALRAAGGAAFGDPFLQGNFSLGGSTGESPITGTSTRLFTLRGLPISTFSRDRAWVASAEYRLPLFRLQRGLGTMPLALNSAHVTFFTDIGDAFSNPSFRPLLGVGAELRGDFIIGYHLPIMGRVGYGIILTNRDRIAGATDDFTGADARNGVLILTLGTSF